MYILIRTDYRIDIRAERIKVKDGFLYYKLNVDEPSEKWKSIPANKVKSFSIRDHASNHPGHWERNNYQ